MNSDNKSKILLMAGLLVFLIVGFLVFYLIQGKNTKQAEVNPDFAKTPAPTGQPFGAPGNSSYGGQPAVPAPGMNAAGRPILQPPAAPGMISGNAAVTSIADPFAGGPRVIRILPPVIYVPGETGGTGGPGTGGPGGPEELPRLPEYEVPIPAVPYIVVTPTAGASTAVQSSNTGGVTITGGTTTKPPVAPIQNPVSYRSIENVAPNMRLQGPDGVYTGWLVNNNGKVGIHVSLPAGNTVNLGVGDNLCGLKIRSLTVFQMVLENERTRQQLTVPMTYPYNGKSST